MSNATYLPDYHEQDFEYDAPDYLKSASQSTNLKLYRDWRTLWAQRLFHEACEDYDWRRPKETYVHVSEYPYHPEFAEAFAARIGGIHEDGSRLALADIGYFLEKEYGGGLERPDCDYLADILEDIRDAAQFPKNIERALQWLMLRKEKLPPWPNWNVKNSLAAASITEADANTSNAEVNADTFTSTTEIDTHKVTGEKLVTDQNSSEGQQYGESDNNPFDDILSKNFPFEALTQLLHNLHLIDHNTNKASNEAKAGNLRAVIFALRDKKCIIARTSAASISSAFEEVFMAKVSDSYIGKERSNSKSLLKQSWQIEIYSDCIQNIDIIIKSRLSPA